MIAQQKKYQSLQYSITNADVLVGQGNIHSIMKSQSGYWKSYIGSQKNRLICQLRNICKINSIQVKVNNTSMIDITCYINKVQVDNLTRVITSKERASEQIVMCKFKKQIDEVDQIFVDLHSYNKKQVMISYLRFNGMVVRSRKSKKAKSQIFQERRKQNNKKIIKPDQLIYKKSSNDKQKIQKIEQQRKQINIQQNKNKNHLDLRIPQNFQADQLMEVEQIQEQPNYRVYKISQEHLIELGSVSEKWLQAQRKLQASFGVKQQHKVSIKLHPKCFTGYKFCLANLYGQQKAKYVKIIKQLGGLVRQQPSQGCIVAAPHPKGSTLIQFAKLMANTHIVRLSYLDQCYKAKIKLKTNKYQYSMQQYY